MVIIRFALVLFGLSVLACAPSYQVTEELNQVLVPGACRIGTIEYDPGVVTVGPEPLPREPIHLLRQQLEFALEGTDLFTEVTLYEDSEDYVVRGVIREFSDQSGNLNFPGFSRTGTVQVTVRLQLQDTTGTVLFAGDFSQRVASRYGVNEIVFERLAGDFARALREQVRSGTLAVDSARVNK
jgi:hypothetical protein